MTLCAKRNLSCTMFENVTLLFTKTKQSHTTYNDVRKSDGFIYQKKGVYYSRM